MRGESDVENNRAWKCCVVGNIVETRIDENGILSCSEFPDNSFFVLNFVDEWEVYVSVDDKMSVVIAFEKLKNTSREGCPLGLIFCGYVVQFSLILCF